MAVQPRSATPTAWGLDDSAAMTSLNSSHPSRGCSQVQLRSTGGDGLFYCFAADPISR